MSPENEPFLIVNGTSITLVTPLDDPWSVFDCMKISGRLVIVGAGSRAAEFRVFAPIEGKRRIYEFGPAEPRELNPHAMQRQLETAEILQENRPMRGEESTRCGLC